MKRVSNQHGRTYWGLMLYSLGFSLLLGNIFKAQAADNQGLSFSPMQLSYVAKDSPGGVTLNMTNYTAQNYLVQGFVSPMDPDTGRFDSQAGQVPPFVVLPPLKRVEAGEAFSFRIRQLGGQLPQDRESAFVVSLRAIPGVAVPDTANAPALGLQTDKASQVQVALQMNIRLFYRPQGVPARDNATVAKQVKFSLLGTQLRVENPTPYFLTFSVLKVGTQQADDHIRQAMVPPKGIQTYAFQTYSFTAGIPGPLVWRFPGDSQDRHVPL
ncbi:molecular chaperone [Photorhabdus temperata]|uniref:P pilus assembly protein, chaperone PapD n=1 Tax=Photorhabdus temperata subsp. temperata Meg1 TaxID=1393735 RepID=A0A081RRK8_PHOTE|nr:molecular chaperone [Photorhabdus temperata]KER01311.1 P pilus assembly protein, chaperone PapD [Photorhabdus temperata subsp. temperata Meg1]MCT8349137.1 molecular chaperone [Photorhabdus temperata]